MDATHGLLLLIGIITGGYAVAAAVRGTVYCKGGPYSKFSQPSQFWGSVVVYLFWSAMMFYFALKSA